MSQNLSEFELIERFFRQVGPNSSDLAVGIGDDCAIINLKSNEQLCVSIDTMVEGVHFPAGCAPGYIGYRALATALSDLASMGARPTHFTLALTLPEVSEVWLSEFSEGLSQLANHFGICLIGGDTTKGPLTISIQVHGVLPSGEAMLRSGAKPGDLIAVTGYLGDSGGGLALVDKTPVTQDESYLLDRYFQPFPRIEIGAELRNIASSCLDISDGLLGDAGHIARASNCQLNIDIDKVPISAPLISLFAADYMEKALYAGDDYELLFTFDEANLNRLTSDKFLDEVSIIGEVKQGSGVILRREGKIIEHSQKGYRHFE